MPPAFQWTLFDPKLLNGHKVSSSYLNDFWNTCFDIAINCMFCVGSPQGMSRDNDKLLYFSTKNSHREIRWQFWKNSGICSRTFQHSAAFKAPGLRPDTDDWRVCWKQICSYSTLSNHIWGHKCLFISVMNSHIKLQGCKHIPFVIERDEIQDLPLPLWPTWRNDRSIVKSEFWINSSKKWSGIINRKEEITGLQPGVLCCMLPASQSPSCLVMTLGAPCLDSVV